MKKWLLILVGILAVGLFGYSLKGKGSRFQLINTSDQTSFYDLKTGDVYYTNGITWHRVDTKGVDVVVKGLPDDN